MSRFLTTTNTAAPGVTQAILNGNLKLQPGQWIKCGPGKPSRFSHATSTTIYACHPQGGFGQGKVSPTQFAALRQLQLQQNKKAA